MRRTRGLLASGGALGPEQTARLRCAHEHAPRRVHHAAQALVLRARDGFVYATVGVGNLLYSSADWGRTWEKVEVPGNDPPPPRSRDRGLGFAASLPDPERKWRILKTTDGAKSWSDLGDVGFRPQALLFDPRRRALVAVAERGRILVSSDEGRTWSETR